MHRGAWRATVYGVIELEATEQLTNKQSISNFVIVSSEQQRDSATHIHVSILLQTPLTSRLPHNTEESSLCYTVGSYLLSILNACVHTNPKLPNNPSFPSFPTDNHEFILQVCESVSETEY